MNRRDFLKKSGLLLMGAATPNFLLGKDPSDLELFLQDFDPLSNINYSDGVIAKYNISFDQEGFGGKILTRFSRNARREEEGYLKFLHDDEGYVLELDFYNGRRNITVWGDLNDESFELSPKGILVKRNNVFHGKLLLGDDVAVYVDSNKRVETKSLNGRPSEPISGIIELLSKNYDSINIINRDSSLKESKIQKEENGSRTFLKSSKGESIWDLGREIKVSKGTSNYEGMLIPEEIGLEVIRVNISYRAENILAEMKSFKQL